MPNLAGLFDMRTPPDPIDGALSRMADIVDVEGVEYVVRRWSDRRFGAVNLLTGIAQNLEQPAVSQGRLVLFLDGEINNPQELDRRTGGGTLGAAREQAASCLRLYESDGDDFVRLLNGQFNIIIYDSRDGRVKIYNDRLGYRPFYYCLEDGLAAFALEKKALFAALGKPGSLDAMGLLEFVTLGHNLDAHTIFRGIHAMGTGSMLEFRDGSVSERQYWRPSFAVNRPVAPLDRAAEGLASRLRQAVARRSAPERRYGIFLSGGLDSRAVAGALAQVRRDVTSFTFGADDSPDLRLGLQLGQQLGFEHHRLRYSNVSLVELLPRVVWRTEGAIPFHLPLSIHHHKVVRSHADVIFNGHFGGPLSGGHFVPDLFLVRDVRGIVRYILERRSLLRRPALEALFEKTFLRGALEAMERTIETTLRSYGEDRTAYAYNIWDMTVRQPRFTFCSPAVDRFAVEQTTPLTDNDVVDYMLGMPLKYLFLQRLYKRMIMTAYREISDVPWSKTGGRIPSSLVNDLAIHASRFVARRVAPTRRSVRPAPRDPRLSALEVFVKNDFITESLPSEVFSRDGVRRATRAIVDGGGDPIVLHLLLTVAESHRLFVSSPPTIAPPETWP